jgi:hypothetical protein
MLNPGFHTSARPRGHWHVTLYAKSRIPLAQSNRHELICPGPMLFWVSLSHPNTMFLAAETPTRCPSPLSDLLMIVSSAQSSVV